MVTQPVLLIALPLAGAFAAPLVYMASKKALKPYILTMLGINLIISAMLLWDVKENGAVMENIAGFAPPVGIFLAVGSIGGILAALINLFGFFNYMTFKQDKPDLRFSMLYMLGIASSTGIVITGDIFNMFVFFEITSVIAYALVASSKEKASVEGALKYVVLGTIGSSFILLGIGLIYAELRTLNLYDISARIGTMSTSMRLAAYTFLIVGLGVEAELFPFNGWVPSVYGNSDPQIASYLVFAPSKAAIYAIFRVSITLFSFASARDVAMAIGVFTLLIGEIGALAEKEPKRILAYSSIGQMGLIVMATAMNTALGIIAVAFLMISHASGKALLFLSTEYHGTDGFKHPVVLGSAMVGVFTLMGIPPFAGFWGKWYLLLSMANGGMWYLLSIIVLTSSIEAYYLARFMYNGMKTEGEKKPSNAIMLTMVIMALIAIGAGLYADMIYRIVHATAISLLGGGI